MPRDIGEYQIQITQFVDELCYEFPRIPYFGLTVEF